MKKLFFLFLASCMVTSLFAQITMEVKPKLSPLTKKYLAEIKKRTATKVLPEGFIYKKLTDGHEYISAIIKVADAAGVETRLNTIHAFVGTKAGNIWTIQVPVERVEEFTQITGIAYIQLDEPVFPNLDVARKTTRVDSVHGGYNLPMRYSGKDVVVGVLDFGFDYNHPTMYDTLGQQYRVKKVWELNTTGTPPAGYSYGHEITDTNAIKIQGTDNAVQTHGTAVAGMAAGSGFGSTNNARFRGMAYESDLVFVGVRRDSIGDQWLQSGFSDFIDGVNYVFSYATSVSKPAVVNISWGSQSGPHDGTSLFNQACDNLTGAGKIVVMSAGNEGDEKIHLAKTFTATDTVLNTFLTFNPTTYKRTWVDTWGETGKTFCGKVTLYSNGIAGNATDIYCLDDSVHYTYLLGANALDTCFIEFITSTADFNGNPRLVMNIFNKAADSVGITIQGNDGTVNVWDEYYYYGYTYKYKSAFDSAGQSWAVNGNTVSTVSDMGSAQSVLLVGAYASKVNFKDINNHNWSYSGYVAAGNIVPFSSRGPMIDGRIKPDITAPGLTIATAMSSYDTAYTPTGSNSDLTISMYQDPVSLKKFYYGEFTGTSASSPAASGIVALLLQANPALTPQQVKDILFATAIKDSYTGALPAAGNNTWGHGKINAYGAIKFAIQQAGVYQFAGKKLDCVLFPNPNNGSFTIEYTTNKNETLSIEILNMTGNVVTKENWNVRAGDNNLPLNLSSLSKGSYVVLISSKEGSVSIKTFIQ